MKYIADILTGLRIVFAIIVMYSIIFQMWWMATVSLILAIITDAVDGIAARKWSYSLKENTDLWWRHNHGHSFDNVADASLVFLGLIGLSINSRVWLITTILIIIGTMIIVSTVNCLRKINLKYAEKVEIFHGWSYGFTLFSMLVYITTEATDKWTYFVVMYCVATVLVINLKWDRATSRPEMFK